VTARGVTVLIGVGLALLLSPSARLLGAEDPLEDAGALLETIAPLIERELGQAFPKPPKVCLFDLEGAKAVFRVDLAPEILRRYPNATAGQRRTLLDALSASSAHSCVARYSVSAKTIVLVREGFAAGSEAVGGAARELLTAALAHEAVHAHDDGRFDLASLYAGAADREALRAVSMVIEGRAVHYGTAVARALEVSEDVLRLVSGERPAKDRRGFAFQLTYRSGAAFTAALLSRGGAELAERALSKPPTLTWAVFHPEFWPAGKVDPGPALVLKKAFPGAKIEPLSELELRARYAEMDGVEKMAELFRGFRGGGQALVEGTNAAVLAFATSEDAERFLARSLKEVPAAREGKLVARAAGPAAAELVPRLAKVLESLGE
jgi:hypothetical protein